MYGNPWHWLAARNPEKGPVTITAGETALTLNWPGVIFFHRGVEAITRVLQDHLIT